MEGITGPQAQRIGASPRSPGGNAFAGRRIGARLLVLAATLLSASLIVPPASAQTSGQPLPPLSTVSTARTYYRMTVKLEYHGEPTTIEVVVACNVKVTNSRLTGQSWDVSRLPDLYAVRQKDGKAILVQSPNACGGETSADGRVPADFLPIVVVYQDAATMQFGVGYFSEDAYENPLSELKFNGATIARATREEWEAWRRTAPRNSLRPEMRPMSYAWQPGAPLPFSPTCFGAQRRTLPTEIRQRVREYWPRHRPRFWSPPVAATEEVRKILGIPDAQGKARPFGDHPWIDTLIDLQTQQRGLPTRAGGGMIRVQANQRTGKFPGIYFPESADVAAPWMRPELHLAPVLFRTLHVEDERTKGFFHCYRRFQPVDWQRAYLDAMVPNHRTRPVRCRVDDAIVETDHPKCDYSLIFDRDESVYERIAALVGDYPGGSE